MEQAFVFVDETYGNSCWEPIFMWAGVVCPNQKAVEESVYKWTALENILRPMAKRKKREIKARETGAVFRSYFEDLVFTGNTFIINATSEAYTGETKDERKLKAPSCFVERIPLVLERLLDTKKLEAISFVFDERPEFELDFYNQELKARLLEGNVLFPELQTIDVQFVNSKTSPLVRWADFLAYRSMVDFHKYHRLYARKSHIIV